MDLIESEPTSIKYCFFFEIKKIDPSFFISPVCVISNRSGTLLNLSRISLARDTKVS